MTDQERTDLKRPLMKVLEDSAGGCVANADSAALISAGADATRAYAELDGPLDLADVSTAELMKELVGREGVRSYVAQYFGDAAPTTVITVKAE